MDDSETTTQETNNFHTINESTAKSLLEKQPDETVLDHFEQKLKGIGNITRIRILSFLGERDLCVHDLSTLLGLSQSAVSHQLKQLKNQNFVKRKKDGRVVYYSLNEKELQSLQETLETIL
jgi:DNA-binding transcriptional ArsR family regulator